MGLWMILRCSHFARTFDETISSIHEYHIIFGHDVIVWFVAGVA